MDKKMMETLIDQTIDAMAELGEAEQKLNSTLKRIEAVSMSLYAALNDGE